MHGYILDLAPCMHSCCVTTHVYAYTNTKLVYNTCMYDVQSLTHAGQAKRLRVQSD